MSRLLFDHLTTVSRLVLSNCLFHSSSRWRSCSDRVSGSLFDATGLLHHSVIDRSLRAILVGIYGSTCLSIWGSI